MRSALQDNLSDMTEKSVCTGESIKLIEMVLCLSDSLDYISPVISSHHKEVAYLSCRIAEKMDLPPSKLQDLVFAAALHDIGAFSLEERLDLLYFDKHRSTKHTEIGYALLKEFSFLPHVANIVRYHHSPWDQIQRDSSSLADDIILGSILHLSDRISVLLNRSTNGFDQAEDIAEWIKKESGTRFSPLAVDAFLHLVGDKGFWNDLISTIDHSSFPEAVTAVSVNMDMDNMLSFARLLSKIVDFKCPFTAAHSSGVAASAETLARLFGFREEECTEMRIAGYLHDIGKLAVPSEIISKPSSLTAEEKQCMQQHALHTFHILKPLSQFCDIREWASLHHEYLDGSGYPFGLRGDNIPIGAQLLAVADIFTALREDRPYRAGLQKNAILEITSGMAGKGILNQDITGLLDSHYGEISNECIYAQRLARNEYKMIHFDASKQ